MNQKNQKAASIKIAFADDHTVVRKGIVSFLNEMPNFKVIIQAEDGLDLVGKITAAGTQPDITIMDISMPRMNGFDAVAALKKERPDMKILVLSTYTEDIYVVRMLQLGVNGFLPKTCDPKELERALRTIYYYDFYESGPFQKRMFWDSQSDKYKLPDLSAKELEFIKLCCSELTYGQMSQKLGQTQKSIEGCRDLVFKKLNLNSRVSLVLFAVRTGIVTIENPTSVKL